MKSGRAKMRVCYDPLASDRRTDQEANDDDDFSCFENHKRQLKSGRAKKESPKGLIRGGHEKKVKRRASVGGDSKRAMKGFC